MWSFASFGLELGDGRTHQGFLWGPAHEGVHEITLKAPQALSMRETAQSMSDKRTTGILKLKEVTAVT